MMQESNNAGDQVTLQNSIDRCHSFEDKCVGNQKSFIHQRVASRNAQEKAGEASSAENDQVIMDT
jgi:hypothetical protein